MSTGFLIERQLEEVINLPLSLPLVSLEPNSELIVAGVQLTSGAMRLVHAYTQLRISARSPETPATPSLVNLSYGYAYGGIYDKTGQLLVSSVTQCQGTSLAPPLGASGPATTVTLSGPSSGTDEYTYRVVNNCADVTLQLSLTGALKLLLA